MSYDDFWEKLAQAHSDSTVVNAIDQHLSGRAFGEDFEKMRGLTDKERRKTALELPVEAGTPVTFRGSLGAVLSYADAPGRGSEGVVVAVKSANGEITDYRGRVFVQWSDGKLRSVDPQHLALRKAAKNASRRRMTPAELAEAKELRYRIRNRGRMPRIDPDEYPPIPGMEGPFRFRDGHVLYYDPGEGEYYDRKTDMYLYGRGPGSRSGDARLAQKSEDDPCWEDYEMVGTKKNEKGKNVPNCVPEKKAFRLRAASLGDLTSFLKVAEGTLIHKSTKDLWSFTKDADGNFLVSRLFDNNGEPLKI